MGLEEADLAGAHVGDAERAHLADGAEVAQGAADLGRIGQRVGAVHEEDVEALDTETPTPEACVNAVEDVAAGEVVAVDEALACAGPDAALGLVDWT